MFWSGNFIVVRELNFLLKEENVTLSQVLEADDILQECKADNKALMQFLTRPDILAELITLITEEPPQNVELAQQYRHANIACEVLTSPLSMLSDRLSLDTTQMNRLCDFINRDPPLNPLLASYFSKTVEMLLERSPKQDWYLYHIVCLRVLDFFKSRRDFLPNLLRHISTSAIADTFKYFIRLDDLFNKIVMEWLEEHQFLESLIAIICGTYVTEQGPRGPEEPEKGQRETSEKPHDNHTGAPPTGEEQGSPDSQNNPARAGAAGSAAARRRVAAAASDNAAALLCDLVTAGCAADGAATRSRTSWVLVSRLAGAGGVSALLQGVFTSSGAARPHAVVNGCRLLLALLSNYPALGVEGDSERSQVELAVASHLPLLHQALLHHPHRDAQEEGEEVPPGLEGAVGSARVHTAALLAHLALSEGEEVPTTMLTLGTPGVLVDMFFQYPHNNFLHAQLVALCRNAFSNATYRTQYAQHLLVECDLLTRLMDAFEENENKQSSSPRSAYMGHVTVALRCVQGALAAAGAGLAGRAGRRWPAFRDDKLAPTLHRYDTPLGGSYPSENSYEADEITDRLAANYDFSYAMATAGRMDEVDDDVTNDAEVGQSSTHADSAEFMAEGLGVDTDEHKTVAAKSHFLELASHRFDDDMWDDAPEGDAADVLGDASPWEGAGSTEERAGEGWAQFEGDTFTPPYWTYDGDGASPGVVEAAASGVRSLSLSEKPLSEQRAVSLATSLLSAMSGLSPRDIANLVNANLDPLPVEQHDARDTDSSVETADSPAESADSPAESADSPAESADSPAETADSPAGSANSPAKTADSPAKTADSPAETANSPAKTADSPAKTANSPAKTADSPAESVASPAKSVDSSSESADPAAPSSAVSSAMSVKLTDTPEVPLPPSGTDAELANINVPSAPSDVETSLPLESTASVELGSPSADSNTPVSSRVTNTKNLDDRSEKDEVASLEDKKSYDLNSPTESPPDSQKESDLENSNKVLEGVETSER